jgi:hypothetical protein
MEELYVPGLAGSEQSPDTKKKKGAGATTKATATKKKVLTRRRVADAEDVPSSPPSPVKKMSASRQLQSIVKGAAVAARSKEGLKLVVAQEQAEEMGLSDEEVEEVQFELDDAAISAKVTEREERDADKRPKKKQTRKKAIKKKTSVAHVMFSLGSHEGSFHCRLCVLEKGEGMDVEVKSANGVTSNLLAHARNAHTDVLNALVKAQNDRRDVEKEFDGFVAALTPPASSGKVTDHFHVVKRSKDGFEVDLSLLVMIVANSLPFSLIDSRFFADWLTVMGFKLPSEATIKKNLPDLYDCVLREQEAFVVNCNFFSVTFDMWTSIAKHKFLVTTYHTMDDNFELFSAPLDLIPMSCSAYGEFIALAIEARIAAHKFDSCVFMASFSDSGSNCVLAKGKLTPGDEEPCFHHNLKHMLDDVIGAESVNRPKNPVAALDFLAIALTVAVVRGNTQLRNEVSQQAVKKGIPDLEMIAANLTRWEGRYKALERFIELVPAIQSIKEKGYLNVIIEKSQNSFPRDFLMDSFVRRLKSYAELLKRFHMMSKAGQSQTEPTLACVPHWIWEMENLLKADAEDGSFLTTLKRDLFEACQNRMSVFVRLEWDAEGDISVVPNAIKAALLHPRHSHEVQKHFSVSDLYAVTEAIIADTLTMFEKEVEVVRTAIDSSMRTSFPALLSLLKAASGTERPALKWWQELKAGAPRQGNIFCNFFLSARIFLSMPAGGAPSECTFSATTDMVTKKRNRLGDDTLEQMTIVRHYVRSGAYNFNALSKKVRDHLKAREKAQAGARLREENEYE